MLLACVTLKDADFFLFSTPPSSNSPPSTSPVKSAQEEALIEDLKKLFIQEEGRQDKLSSDVKEVTKLEMRNDLSKRQLLYILLASLLQDNPSGVGYTLKSRISLFKTVSLLLLQPMFFIVMSN